MTAWIEPFAYWLADFYLAASILLLAAVVLFALVRQPSLRMAAAWGIVPGLLLAAGLCLSTSRPHFGLRPAPRIETKPAEVPSNISPAPSAPIISQTGAGPVDEPEDTRFERFEPPSVAVEPAAPIVSQPSVARVDEPGRPAWVSRLVAGLVGVFLAGSLLVTSRLALGVWRASRLVRESEPAPRGCVDELLAIVGTSGHSPRLRLNRRLLTPVATGAVRPAILLPEESSRGDQPQALRAVLAHEWTHIKNGDLWLLAFDRIVLSLLWAHPLYWWTRRRIRADQEFLADAAAAAQIGSADYAALLVQWARKVTEQRSLAALTAVGIWERPAGLTERVTAILAGSESANVRTSGRTRVSVAALLALMSLLAATVSFRPPQAELARAEEEVDPVPAPSLLASPPVLARLDAPVRNDVVANESALNDVQGTCRDKQGKPLAGVQVFLYAFQKAKGRERLVQQGTTDAQGRFRFPDCLGKKVVQLSWQLFDDDGSVFEVFARRTDLGTVAKTVQERGQPFDFTLTKSASLAGTVRDRQGRPVAGALIRDIDRPLPKTGWLSAQSDAQGNFAITDLSEYQYAGPKESGPPLGLLSIEHPQYATAKVSYQRVPGHVEVVLGKPATIEGTVVYGDTGKPAAGVFIFAHWIEEPLPFGTIDLPSAQSDKNGHYRLGPLPPGLFNVSASVESFEKLMSFAKTSSGLDDRRDSGLVAPSIEWLRAEEGKTASAPQIRLVKGGIVKGTLYQYRPGVNGVHDPVRLKEGEKVQIIVFRGPSLPGPGVVADMAFAKPDGTFELRLPPGLHYLTLSNSQKPDGTWRLSYSDMHEPCTEEDATPPQLSGLHRIKIREGRMTEIELSVFRPLPPEKIADEKKTQNTKSASPQLAAANDNSPAPVTGAVNRPSTVAGAPVPAVSPKIVDYHLEKDSVGGLCLGRDEVRFAGVDVALYIIGNGRNNDGYRFIGRTLSNDEGQFVLRPVPNLKKGEELYLFIARKKGLATSEGTLRQRHDWVDLRMGPGVSMNGVVRDEQGKPIAGALVRGRSYWSYGVPDESPSVHTNERGEFRIDDLQRFGACSVSHPDYLSAGFGDVKKNPVVATLRKASIVEGQVIDGETGQPVAGAHVTLQTLGYAAGAYAFRGRRGDKHGRTVTTDSEGRYQFRSLWPGTFNLTFRGRPGSVESANIHALRVGRSQTVEVPPVRLAKGAIVAVQLIDNERRRNVDMQAAETVVIGIRSGEGSTGADAQPRLETLHMRSDGTIGVWLPPGKHAISLSGGPYFSIGDVLQGMGHDFREVDIKGGEEPTVDFRVLRIERDPDHAQNFEGRIAERRDTAPPAGQRSSSSPRFEAELQRATFLMNVDESELQKAVEANRQHPKTIPEPEIQKLRLTYERSRLKRDLLGVERDLNKMGTQSFDQGNRER